MTSRWAFLEEASSHVEQSGQFDHGGHIATLLSERLIASLSADDRAALDCGQAALERHYLKLLRKAPASAVHAARGEGDGGTPEAAAFALGQVGLAHAVAARAVASRVDAAFERRLRSVRFEKLVRLLVDRALSGREIADELGKDEADVSRRLKLLRQIGAVECRREGTRVVNFLTHAARAVARARNMGGLAAGPSGGVFPSEVTAALNDQRERLPDHVRRPLVMSVPHDLQAAS